MEENINNIKNNLKLVRQQIQQACESNGREPSAVKLIAVSKMHSIDTVKAAIQAGQTIFGENRVQEANDKFNELKKINPSIQLHLIGPLQTNKVSVAIKLFDVIQTLDRPKLAEKLATVFKTSHKKPTLFIQINTGNESQKSGISIKDTDEFILYCTKDLKLNICGLMCIPPVNEPPNQHFNILREIAKHHQLKELSMGMSQDFKTAIQYGATYLRIGTAIFGKRN